MLILINKGPSNVNFLICRHQQSISDEGTRRILSLVWSNILCDSNNSKNIKSNCKIQNICCTPQYNRIGSSFFKNSCHWFSYVGPFQGGFFLNQMMRIWRPWIGARGRTKFVVHAIWKKKKKKKISTRCPEKRRFWNDSYWWRSTVCRGQWAVCTPAFWQDFWVKNYRFPGFWELLSTVHSSAVQSIPG